MNFTLEEKECITKKKKEIKEAGEAIRKKQWREKSNTRILI